MFLEKHFGKSSINRLVKRAQETSVFMLTDHLDMTIAVDWDIKPYFKQA